MTKRLCFVLLFFVAAGICFTAGKGYAVPAEEARKFLDVKEGDRYIQSGTNSTWLRKNNAWVLQDPRPEADLAAETPNLQIDTRGGDVYINTASSGNRPSIERANPIPLLRLGGPAVRFPELAPNGKPIWRKLVDLGLIRQYFSGDPSVAVVPLSRFTQLDYHNIETRCVNLSKSWIYYTQREHAAFHGEKRPLGGSWTQTTNSEIVTMDLNVIWGYRDSLLISAHPGTHHSMIVACLEYTLKSDPVIDYPVFFRSDGAWVAEDGRVVLERHP